MEIERALDRLLTSERTMKVSFVILYASNNGGKITVVTRYAQQLDVPEGLVRPETTMGVWISGEVHWFKEHTIAWSRKTGCMIQLVWPKADDYEFLKNIRDDNSWIQTPFEKQPG